jgi:hypothetical protein
MPFEVFRRQRITTDKPSVTIQKKGLFSINAPAFDELGKPEAVEFLYDRENQVIGIRPVERDADHAYFPRAVGRGSTWLIAGTAFTKFYGIDVSEARRRTVEVKDGTLLIDLKDPGVVAVSNRTVGEAKRAGS